MIAGRGMEMEVRATGGVGKDMTMGRDERDTRNRWQGERQQPDDLPEFDDDLGPTRSPLQELREQPLLGDDDDLVEDPTSTPTPRPVGRRRVSRPIDNDLPLSGTALIATIAYFAIGGLALIVTGLILGGFAGILLALVGLLSAACAGLAAWQVFFAGGDQRV